jgi:hypothetical protein
LLEDRIVPTLAPFRGLVLPHKPVAPRVVAHPPAPPAPPKAPAPPAKLPNLTATPPRVVFRPGLPPSGSGSSGSGASPSFQGSGFFGEFAPSDIRTAYGISPLISNGSDGTGITVAIIDAYDNPMFVSDSDPNFATSDLHYFDVQFNLPETAGFFTKVNQNGGSNYPMVGPQGQGWEGEEALDVEWVHAIAPGAKIILVECNSPNFSDFFKGIDWATRSVANGGGGANVVSMSFGTLGGSSAETAFDSHFKPSTHPGVTFVASTGDIGTFNGSTGRDDTNGQAGYPADSPYVLGVGGTSLTVVGGGNFNYKSETVWNNGLKSAGVYQSTGGGLSGYEPQPGFQQGLVIHSGNNIVTSNNQRAAPDVAFLADPQTGVAGYDSYDGGQPYGGTGSSNNWFLFGGTSLSAPCWAGLIAIADQVRAGYGLAPLTGGTDVLPTLYQMASNSTIYANDFHDVTSGDNGTWSAGPGYDLDTGLGTPIAANLIPDLVGAVVTGVTSTTKNGSYGAGITIPITVTFDVPVTVTGTPLLALNSGGTASYASGSGSSTLTFNYVTATGDLSDHLDFSSTSALTLNGGTISVTGSSPAEPANLSLMAVGSPGSLSANKNLVVDTVAPTVTNVTSSNADGVYGPAANIAVDVVFSETVVVSGTPLLALSDGATASYTGGSNSNTLVFTYTVVPGETTHGQRLDYSSTGALTLNGGTIQDTVTNNPNAANLTLPAPGASGSLSANKNIQILAVANQPPFDAVPGAQSVLFNPAAAVGLQTAAANQVVYSAANGNAVTVTDPDSGTNPVVTTLSVTGGTVTVPAGWPGTVTVAHNGTATVTLTGPVADVTTALDGVAYAPAAGFTGTDTLTVSTNDQGYTGLVGAQTDTRTTPILVVGLYISEVMLGAGADAPAPEQYVEVFSTTPSYTIPDGIYLAGVNGQDLSAGGALAPGVVQDLFTLGGLTTGANGYLALLEAGQQYGGAGALDGGGTELTNSGSGGGFGDGGSTSQFGSRSGVHQGASRAGKGAELTTDVAQGSETFLLVQAPSATAPAVGTNIDPGNSGTPSGSTDYGTWNVLDSVGLLGNSNGTAGADHSYGAITFASDANTTGTTLTGSKVVSTGAWTATYLGRNARNTGVTGGDWLASVPTGGGGLFVLGAGQSTASGGQALNHVGGPNDWAPRASTAVMDGTSAQHSQVTELTVTFSEPVDISSLSGAFVVTDAQGNALSINVLVTAGTDNGNGTASGVRVIQITFNQDGTHTYALSNTYTDRFGTVSGVALNDGNYVLKITAADVSNNGVQLDGARNGTAGTNQTDEFWRLYGDTLGRRQVDWTDNAALVSTYGKSQGNAAYIWYLDYDLSYTVDSTDRGQFVARRATILSA